MKKRFILYGEVLFIAVSSLLFLVFQDKKDGTEANVLMTFVQETEGTENKQTHTISVSLAVLLPDEEERYEVSLPEGSTVYELMKIVRQTRAFDFQGRDFSGLGFFVESIQGVSQDARKGMYWVYSVNNQKAKVGISSYILQPQDIISWTYEKASD